MKHLVTIEALFRNPKKPFNKIDAIVQTKLFELGFRITNCGKEPIRGFSVKRPGFESAEGMDIIHVIDKSFHVDTLNPDASIEVWVGKLGTYMSGLTKVFADIKPDADGDLIETQQIDKFTRDTTEYVGVNRWLDFTYIQLSAEATQNANNSLMTVFTVFMVILSIINAVWFYRFQVKPAQYELQRREYEALTHCEQSPDSNWPSANGGTIPCKDVLKIKDK